jgi:putative tryptophan/tyrosine transport system substrate-binding protein
MRRREFITLLGGAVTAWPLAARAQQIAIPVIGFLAGPSAGEFRSTLAGFRNGLRQAGYVEGQNVHIAFRWAEGRYDRFPELASLPVAVIVAISAPAALAAISATKTIPVVFASSADPVRLGIVASLNRPGGNATGVAFLQSELVGKYFELLREMLPKAAVTGLLVNPTSANAETQALGLRIVVQKASNDRELDTSFATFSHQGVGALVVASDPFFYGRREQLASLAARYALPTIHNDREYVAEGGLISCGASTTDAYRQVGVFTGWILKGNKPADLPVQQVTKLELVINLKTAKAIGLDVPPTLLARADEVWLKFKKSSGVSEDRRGVVEVASAAII